MIVIGYLQSKVSVRLMTGELLLDKAWPDFLESQVRAELIQKGIHYPRPTDAEEKEGMIYHLHFVGENSQECCQYFLHGHTYLVVIVSPSKYFGLDSVHIIFMLDTDFALLERNAAEFVVLLLLLLLRLQLQRRPTSAHA